MCAGLWSSRRDTGVERRQVRFDGIIKYHYIPAYSTIYGRHPNTFHFAADGSMVKAKSDDFALMRSGFFRAQYRVTMFDWVSVNVKRELMSAHCPDQIDQI